MGNPLRGEAELAIPGGALGPFTLVLRTNALAGIQAAWGLTTGVEGDQTFLDRLFTLPVALQHDLRVALFHALQEHHRKDVPDLYTAGVIIDAAGASAVRKALLAALVTGFPEASGEKGDSPPKAARPGPGLE